MRQYFYYRQFVLSFVLRCAAGSFDRSYVHFISFFGLCCSEANRVYAPVWTFIITLLRINRIIKSFRVLVSLCSRSFSSSFHFRFCVVVALHSSSYYYICFYFFFIWFRTILPIAFTFYLITNRLVWLYSLLFSFCSFGLRICVTISRIFAMDLELKCRRWCGIKTPFCSIQLTDVRCNRKVIATHSPFAIFNNPISEITGNCTDQVCSCGSGI